MTNIWLNLINNSSDRNNDGIVIFQKNEATATETPVAWRVIHNLGSGWSHPFTYPVAMAVAASDGQGNYSLQLPAATGQQYQLVTTDSGDVLEHSGPAANEEEIIIYNALATGIINVHVYRDGKLLALKKNVEPGQPAVFQFKPTLWIGVAHAVTEGALIDSAFTSQVHTQLSLSGISSADIIMTGGGLGPDTTPVSFSLQNVRYA